MIPSELTAIIQVHYPGRLKDLPRIVEALFSGTLTPSKLILWANGLESRTIRRGMEQAAILVYPDRFHFIESSENTLLGRYAGCLLAETPYVVILDDDLIPGRRTLERLAEVVENHPHRVAGIFGMNFGEGKPYLERTAAAPGRCDMVLGRCFMAHKKALIPGFTKLLEGWVPGRSDDILMSGLAEAWAVDRSGDAGVTNLDENQTGLSFEPGHYEERDAFAARMLKERSFVP